MYDRQIGRAFLRGAVNFVGLALGSAAETDGAMRTVLSQLAIGPCP